MAIQGLRNAGVTGGTGAANDFVPDQRPLDWRTGVLLLYPNGRAPLTALTSQMKKRVTTDPQFHWWDKSLQTQRYVLGEDLDDSETDITFAGAKDARHLRPGHVLLVEATGELMRVESITSDTIIEVERGAAGSTAAAVTLTVTGTNPNVLIIGSAFEEGSSKPLGINFDPTKRTNFTQIFRWNIGMTRTAAKTRLRTGDQVREAKREALEYHSIEQEKAFWLGAQYEGVDASSGRPIRYTGGFWDFVDPKRDWSGGDHATDANRTGAGSTRVKDFGALSAGVVGLETLEEFLKDIFEFGSSEKLGFCGNRALLTINQIVRKNSVYNIYFGEKEYGMDVARLICPFGSLVLKTHPLWNQNPSGTGGTTPGPYYGMDSWLAVMDMNNLTYRPLEGSDTKYVPNQQENGQDGMESGYIAECGLEFAHPVTHALARGLSSAADPS